MVFTRRNSLKSQLLKLSWGSFEETYVRLLGSFLWRNAWGAAEVCNFCANQNCKNNFPIIFIPTNVPLFGQTDSPALISCNWLNRCCCVSLIEMFKQTEQCFQSTTETYCYTFQGNQPKNDLQPSLYTNLGLGSILTNFVKKLHVLFNENRFCQGVAIEIRQK